MLLVRGDQPLGVGFVGGDRFLDHHVQALLERRDAERRVLVMRGGDDDRVHQAGANQLLAVGERLQRLVFLQLGRHGIGHGHQFGAADLAGGEVAKVVLADIAQADDPQAHFVHARESNRCTSA